MKAVILAGGKGTRLGSLTREIPKPMIPIGGVPLLHHQVNLLVKYGITEIILLVNYLSRPIRDYFGNGEKFGAKISFFEEKEPLGTTGGLKEIQPELTDDFLVFYGDVMINMDLNRLIRFHKEKNSQCTLVLHPNNHPYDSDLAETDDSGKITAFHSKPHDKSQWYHNLVNAGVCIFSPVIFNYIQKGKKADFGRDIFPVIYGDLRMYGYHTSEYLKDMGTPDRLAAVQSDYNSGRIRLGSYEYLQRAVFLDRDGVINVERNFLRKPDELEIFDFTPGAIRKINQSGFLSIVVTNQSAVARNLCTEEDVKTIHKKLETELGKEHAWLDAIYYCPHHPDGGFPEENPAYKIICDCRKPATGMFNKAIEKFRIDRAASYMIGDSERDIQAGINIGCTTVGVRTGYGIRKTCIFPDFMFDNLAEAADFITTDPYKKHFDEVNSRLTGRRKNSPAMILIGGNSRTGKSILASYLRKKFEREGKRVLQVVLDNWIIPEKQRNNEMNVFDRFRLKEIEADIKQLLDGKSVTVSSYANHPQRGSFDITYDPLGSEIIIVEGVVGLSSETLRNRADLKIFTTAGKDVFTGRMHNYYKWRGMSTIETAELMKKRETDEYQLIEKESKLADMIVNSAGI